MRFPGRLCLWWLTGHNSSGRSQFDVDDEVAPYHFKGGPTVFNDVFWADDAKPDLSAPFVDESKDHVGELVSENGSSFKVTDTPPGQKSVRVLRSIRNMD